MSSSSPAVRQRRCLALRNSRTTTSVTTCRECDEFGRCEKLKLLEQHHGKAHLKNLRKIKKQGPKAFITGKRYWYAAK